MIVIRNGKKIKKKKLTDQEKMAGYKIFNGNKVKMSAIEKMKREKAAMKSARKSRSKRRIANMRRLKSIQRRPMGKI